MPGERGVAEPEGDCPSDPTAPSSGPTSLLSSSLLTAQGSCGRPHGATASAAPESPGTQPVGPETPSSPTVIEAGELTVEVRPTPAIGPPYIASGVTAYVSPRCATSLPSTARSRRNAPSEGTLESPRYPGRSTVLWLPGKSLRGVPGRDTMRLLPPGSRRDAGGGVWTQGYCSSAIVGGIGSPIPASRANPPRATHQATRSRARRP